MICSSIQLIAINFFFYILFLVEILNDPQIYEYDLRN